MAEPSEVISRSVAREDFGHDVLWAQFLSRYGVRVPMNPEPPTKPSASKDKELLKTIYYHARWRNAVSKASTKFAAHNFEISSNFAIRAERMKDICLMANFGAGWVDFAEEICSDYLLTGNNYFVEIVRATDAIGSPVIGLVRLNPLQCIRTNEPERPVIYQDLNGEWHWLNFWQVFFGRDNRGYPYSNSICAAESVWRTIYKMSAIEARISEIEAASSFTGVDFVSGVSEPIIDDSQKNATEKRRAVGQVYHKGRLIIPTMGDQVVASESIDLIDRPPTDYIENERLNADLDYAGAVGINPALQNPNLAAKVALDSGSVTQRQSEQANSTGLASLIKNFTHNMDTKVMPASTSFFMLAPDLSEIRAREEIRGMRIDNTATLVNELGLTQGQGLNMLADTNDIPEEFGEPDETQGAIVSDTGISAG